MNRNFNSFSPQEKHFGILEGLNEHPGVFIEIAKRQ